MTRGDGSHVLMTDTGPSSSWDVWDLVMGPKPRARAVLETAFNEYHAVLSPDGRWMAYVSDLTGAPQVYVMSFPDGELRLLVPLFQTRVPMIGNPYRQQYAAAADGQRFLVNTAPVNAPTPALHVVLDWRALLDARRK